MAVAGQVERPEVLVTQEVSFRSEGTKIPAYLARPRESGRYPGVILIHDIFGVSDHARDVARRFANVGFVTLVPDCFARIDLGTDETQVRSRAGQLDDRLTVRDLEGAVALLRGLAYSSGKIGTVGFCMGGRSALLFASSSDKVNATIDCWGGGTSSDSPITPQHPVPVVELVKNLRRPVYAVLAPTTKIHHRHTRPNCARILSARTSWAWSPWKRSQTRDTRSLLMHGQSAIVRKRPLSCGRRWSVSSKRICRRQRPAQEGGCRGSLI